MSICAALCKTSKIAGACRVVPPRAAKWFLTPFLLRYRSLFVCVIRLELTHR